MENTFPDGGEVDFRPVHRSLPYCVRAFRIRSIIELRLQFAWRSVAEKHNSSPFVFLVLKIT